MKVLFLMPPDGRIHTILPLPVDRYLARQLYVFLVEQMKPGWRMVLVGPHGTWEEQSGQTISQQRYEEIMADFQPDR